MPEIATSIRFGALAAHAIGGGQSAPLKTESRQQKSAAAMLGGIRSHVSRFYKDYYHILPYVRQAFSFFLKFSHSCNIRLAGQTVNPRPTQPPAKRAITTPPSFLAATKERFCTSAPKAKGGGDSRPGNHLAHARAA